MIYTVESQHAGNPHPLTVAYFAAPNLERLVPTGRGTFRHVQDESEITLSGALEVEHVQ